MGGAAGQLYLERWQNRDLSADSPVGIGISGSPERPHFQGIAHNSEGRAPRVPMRRGISGVTPGSAGVSPPNCREDP